jgi:hypothetical protein
MARYKPIGKSKDKAAPAAKPTKGLIPCLLVVLGGIALFSLFFYAALKSAK